MYLLLPAFISCGNEPRLDGTGESDTNRGVDSAHETSTDGHGSDPIGGTENPEDAEDDSSTFAPDSDSDGDSEQEDTGIEDTQGQDTGIADTQGLDNPTDVNLDSESGSRETDDADDSEEQQGGTDTELSDTATTETDVDTCSYPPVSDCLSGDGCCPVGCGSPADSDCIFAWMKAYGGDNGYVSSTQGVAFEDGHIVSASLTNGYGADGMDCVVIKTDRSGEVVWSKKMSSGVEGAIDVCNRIITGDDGAVLVVGVRDNWTDNGSYDRDGWAFLLNRDGEVEWQYIFYGGDGESIEGGVRTADGDFVLVGTSRTYNQSEYLGIGAVVFKLSYDSGELLWLRNIASTRGGPFELYDVTETQDTDLILSGYSTPWGGVDSSPAYASWFLRTDSDVSEIKWQRTYRYQAGTTIGFRHMLHSSGDILGLASVSVADPLSAIGNIWDQGAIFRLDGATGTIVWDRIFDYTVCGESTDFWSPVETPNGDVWIMGRIETDSPVVPLRVQMDFETGNTIAKTVESKSENWELTQFGTHFGNVLYGYGNQEGDVFEDTQALHFSMPFSEVDTLFSADVDIQPIPADLITENVNIDDGTKERFRLFTPDLNPMPEGQLATVDIQDLPLTTTSLYP